MPYRLLTEFEALFSGRRYLHRVSNQGDYVAMHLFEDLVVLDRSNKIRSCVSRSECVVNLTHKRRGIDARRGDGTFGDLIVGEPSSHVNGYLVPRGPLANVHIGVEVKILSKAMIKQIDRVIGDLAKQVDEFKRGGRSAICVAIVGINCAPYTVSYERERAFRTDGSGAYRHPIDEAEEAESRIRAAVQSHYDEFLVLRYRATNDDPYPFEWVDRRATATDYAASLLRISREYDQRF